MPLKALETLSALWPARLACVCLRSCAHGVLGLDSPFLGPSVGRWGPHHHASLVEAVCLFLRNYYNREKSPGTLENHGSESLRW